MRLLLILSFIFSLPVMAQVNSMDIETHTLLIEKLELGSSVNKDVSVELRIADLYSDRARLKSIEETEKNCKQCMSSNEDRKKAIKVYRSVFNKVDNTQRLRVFEQITQNLYALGLGVQADKFGQNIISGKYSKSLKAVALINRANQKFFKNKYREALTDYQMVLAKHPG
ncbi:MAG: hypothetical protein KDD50_05305, partial [Bdellovibrionales bacterium]|nr:hypothetical protein [Bdellovibrionales bacterium]